MNRASHDWTRLDGMIEAQRHDAAVSDPDAQPLTPEDAKRMKCTPQVQIIRPAPGLSLEECAACFHIPLGTLRDWEQSRKDPDAAARPIRLSSLAILRPSARRCR
jgi:putative transcriptional regulator